MICLYDIVAINSLEKEIDDKKKEFEETMKYLCSELERLKKESGYNDLYCNNSSIIRE